MTARVGWVCRPGLTREALIGVLMTTLDSLIEGQRGKILDVSGDDAVSVRLMEMGLIEGEEIENLGASPLGDPVEYLVRGYRLSLRNSEAQRVQIERI